MSDDKAGVFDFDFNKMPKGWRSDEAARHVSESELAALFAALERATALWNDPLHGERASVLAALQAVEKFLEPHSYGVLSRPFAILQLELSNAGAPDPGNVWPPWTRGQTPERGRRQYVDRGKAAAAYAAHAINRECGVTLPVAAKSVADVMLRHKFPLSDYTPGVAPRTRDQIATRVHRWRDEYRKGAGVRSKGEDAAPEFFKQFCGRSPLPRRKTPVTEADVLQWLALELERIGYEQKR